MQSTWRWNCCWLRRHSELIAIATSSRGSARRRRASTSALAFQAAAKTRGASAASICGSSIPVMRRVGMASIWARPLRSLRMATPACSPLLRSTLSQGIGPSPASLWTTHCPCTIRHSASGSAAAIAEAKIGQETLSATSASCLQSARRVLGRLLTTSSLPTGVRRRAPIRGFRYESPSCPPPSPPP